MQVILIPCSSRKRRGGGPLSELGQTAPGLLSPESRERLLDARAGLCKLLDLARGPDLGLERASYIEFMAAYRRYDGNLYRQARLTAEDWAGGSDTQILIVSALYGLLTAVEPIRQYNLAMSNRLPNGRRVSGWWTERKLGEIVCETLDRLRADHVQDLLSEDYRQALSPWPPSDLKATYTPHDYPGLGSGSNFHRGDDLRRLLKGA